MSIIKDIFGRENGLTESDLQNSIGKYQETSSFECKVVDRGTNNDWKNIIKTIIGFLNKPEKKAGGLLMIGFEAPDGIIKDIHPINNNNFKQDKLRNKLLEDIASIPSGNDKYGLNVLEIPIAKGYVILAEVHKTDPNAVFYSKSENTSYIRRSDTTKNLDLGELFKISNSKSYAIVYPHMAANPILPIVNNFYKYSINVSIRNSGVSPGRDVIVFLKFSYVYGNKDPQISDIKSFQNNGAANNYFMILEKDVMQINSKPVYPHLDLNLGSFFIDFHKNTRVVIDTITYENRGYTMKKFILANGKFDGCDYEFHPYNE